MNDTNVSTRIQRHANKITTPDEEENTMPDTNRGLA
jgi:hypothetical protein